MNSVNIIMDALEGRAEKDICLAYDINYHQLDEIMTGHGYVKCVSCVAWRPAEQVVDGLCSGCQEG